MELSHKPRCVHDGLLNQFSEGPSHTVHHEPKSVTAEHKFSLCTYTWSLSLLPKVSLFLFDLLVTYIEAFYQLFVPATLSFCFHGRLPPKPSSQLQSSKLLPFLSQVPCFLLFLALCFCKTLSTHMQNVFVSPQYETILFLPLSKTSLWSCSCIISLPPLSLKFSLVLNYIAMTRYLMLISYWRSIDVFVYLSPLCCMLQCLKFPKAQ